MATKNVWAACVAALFVMVMNVLTTSCGSSEDFKLTDAAPQVITNTVVKPVNFTSYINNYSWIEDNNIMVNGYKAMTYDVFNKFAIIEMATDMQGMPEMTSSTDTSWNWSDGQISTSSIETFGNDSLWISGSISPLYDEFEAVRLHEKVLKILGVYQMTGAFNLANRGLVNFSQKLSRSHYQVDSSVRVDTVTTIDHQIEYIFKEIHDTTVVEILREVYVPGAEVNTNISNNWGFATATMDLGNNRMLTLTITHNYNPIAVKEFGANLASAATATQWNWSDGQLTISNASTNNCTITSITMTGVEDENVEGIGGCLIKTTFHITGYYINENGDRKDFEFDMVPMYLQIKEATPEPKGENKPMYRGIIRKVSVDGLKLMCKPVVQQRNNDTNAWEDIRTASRVCIGLSGSPSGLDLFVKSRKVVEENEDSHWYTATGNPEMDKQWIGEDKKEDGTIVYRNTKVYNFNFMFTADAVNNGLVGPQTELYVMKADKVTVTDPNGNALVCTWEDGSEFSLSTSVKLNDTKYVDDPALVGKTRTESDKLYKYDTTFTQNFTASIGGKELQNVTAKSPLWIPAE